METPTLDDLLVKPTRVELATGRFVDGQMQYIGLYVRRLSQIERDLCSGYARRESRKMRRELENPDSEKRQVLIDDEVSEYTLETLRQHYVNSKIVERALEITHRSLEDRDQTYTPEPEGDVILPEDVETYENTVEEVEKIREDSVREQVQLALSELIKEAEGMNQDELMSHATPATINAVCSDIFTQEYVVQMIWRGTYKDNKFNTPAFDSADEVKRLAPSALESLSAAHQALLLDPEAIKNLAGNHK